MSSPWWKFWRQEASAGSVTAASTSAPNTRLDGGYQNLLTGLGISGKDKRLGATFGAAVVSYEECRELWRGNDLGARIVELIPREMLRQGFDLSLGDQTDQLGPKVKAKLDDLKAIPALKLALQYQRAYGGGAIWLGVDDGQTDLRQPLKETALRSLSWLEVYAAPREIQVATYSNDPTSRNFGKPETYRITTGGRMVELHHSRLIVFRGPVVDRQHQLERQGFGDSVFVRVAEVLSDFGQSFASVPLLIADFSQSVYKLKDLASLLAANQEDLVTTRIQMMELMRSILRGVVIDKEEEWSRQSTSVAGLGDLLDKLSFRLAAAAETPATLLFGQAPAGLNATGDSDIRNFYDRVSGEQEESLRPPLEQIIRLIFLAKDGPSKGREPAVWSVVFRSLWQLTGVQQAELRNKQANTDKIYIEAGVVTANEVALSRFSGDYSVETEIDVAARKKSTPPAPQPNGVPS